MTRTKQQELEQAQNLHLIRDERDLELENRARSRAHAGLQLGCLLLGALGIANMWLAIFADVGVMILAVLNAIRALFVKKL